MNSLTMKGILSLPLVLLVLCSSNTIGSGQGPTREQFNTVLVLGFQPANMDLRADSIDFSRISATVIDKVTELIRNKKFSVVFAGTGPSTSVTEVAPQADLFLHITMNVVEDELNRGVEVYYADENDYTFQSVKYANLLVSEIRSSKLNLKVNGMNESDIDALRNAKGPALLVNINLANTNEDKALLKDEEKIAALARMIYECIERIAKS